MQSDAITPVQSAQSVPQSIAAVLSERKDRTRLGLSKYAAEAAEQSAEHRDKLGITGKVKDLADIHAKLFPEPVNQPQQILNVAILTDPNYKPVSPRESGYSVLSHYVHLNKRRKSSL